jgi:hypothetical protein
MQSGDENMKDLAITEDTPVKVRLASRENHGKHTRGEVIIDLCNMILHCNRADTDYRSPWQDKTDVQEYAPCTSPFYHLSRMLFDALVGSPNGSPDQLKRGEKAHAFFMNTAEAPLHLYSDAELNEY